MILQTRRCNNEKRILKYSQLNERHGNIWVFVDGFYNSDTITALSCNNI